MLLDTNNAESCRRLIARGQSERASLACFTGFTLPGLMELLVSAVEAGQAALLLAELQAAASAGHWLIAPLIREWESGEPPSCPVDVHGTRTVEFFRIQNAASVVGTDFQLVQERLSRSMRQAGFSKEFALAMAKVFFEMAENVNQHSGLFNTTAKPLTGLAGYHVAAGYAAISVVDLGIGAWASLTSSRDWKHLRSPSEALRSIIVDHASRREGQGPGEGFRQVLRALADRNSVLRLRSDDTAIVLKPSDTQRIAGAFSSPALRGLQVSLVCDIRGTPGEKKILTQ